MTREQFARSAIQIIRKRFPLAKISRAGKSFSLKLNGRVASLENLYRSAILSPEDTQRAVERWAAEMIRADEGTPDEKASFDELKERLLPMVVALSDEEAARQPVLTGPLIDGLRIAYVIDGDRTITYLQPVMPERWKVSLDDIHDTAIENLIKRSDELKGHAATDEGGDVNLILFQSLDGYDASRVLLPSLHDRLREYLGSPFCAAVPNRDMMICFRNDAATITRLREQVREDYRKMPHQVTDRLLLVTRDGLAPLE
jgi:uncharacterized protein YtpQ (UPF0354 family)